MKDVSFKGGEPMNGEEQGQHWNPENADPAWRSLHYITGGHFDAIGDVLSVQGGKPDD